VNAGGLRDDVSLAAGLVEDPPKRVSEAADGAAVEA